MSVKATYRPELPPRPPRIAALPLDERAYPVPWFVATVDGRPDHRLADIRNKFPVALRERRCWVCGQTRGLEAAFVVGPMCVVNRVSSEPPCHVECAVYSAMSCPFLTKPHAKRREAGLPANVKDAPGVMLKGNPGCMAVYITQSFKAFDAGDGILLRMNPPTEPVKWFTEGRTAGRDEVQAAFNAGIPNLRRAIDAPDSVLSCGEAATDDAMRELDAMIGVPPPSREREAEHRELNAAIATALRYLPPERSPTAPPCSNCNALAMRFHPKDGSLFCLNPACIKYDAWAATSRDW